MKLEIHETSDVFDLLRPEWNDLLHRSTADRIFSTWEWQMTWWQAYHPGQLWLITCRMDDGRLVGIAPWFIENHPEKGRMIRSVGCVDVTDYLDVIIETDLFDSVLDCFASVLIENRDQFDVLDLCNIPEQSPTYERFPVILQRYGFSVEVKHQEVCPIITLPDDFETYLSGLSKKERHEMRRKIRRAEGAPENIDWYIVGESHDLKVEMDRFLELMAASDPQKAEFLSDPQNVDFFQRMVPAVYEKGWLQLNFLTVGGEAAAAYLNFDYGNHILVYNSGLQPQGYSHLSPGIVLIAHNIRHAIETGHDEFDFLRGNESYKYRLGGQDTNVHMLIARLNGN